MDIMSIDGSLPNEIILQESVGRTRIQVSSTPWEGVGRSSSV